MKPTKAFAVIREGELFPMLYRRGFPIFPELGHARSWANDAPHDGETVVPVLIVPEAMVREAWACMDEGNEIGLASLDSSLMAISPTKEDAHAELALDCTVRIARVAIIELEDA